MDRSTSRSIHPSIGRPANLELDAQAGLKGAAHIVLFFSKPSPAQPSPARLHFLAFCQIFARAHVHRARQSDSYSSSLVYTIVRTSLDTLP